ncbi:hypothetical protein [Flavobacterium silvaticum]|uniref:Uncharacterized protein n=1 Tax=Flavobacterium silvaticum TaxID=1852020 RepID=A0A972FIU4_9FLAO|nr:hypothetical protein [Flavobacterium silvaticum]NMH26553.1 hypothetical protein [Flavobacterium silvaticum]
MSKKATMILNLTANKFYSIILLLLFQVNYSQVKLSFKKDSLEDFKLLKVEFSNSTHTFKNLKSGEITLPIILEGSFAYCPMQIITQKDTLRFYPIDYIGEKFYKSGKLRMDISILELQPKRSIKIKAKR